MSQYLIILMLLFKFFKSSQLDFVRGTRNEWLNTSQKLMQFFDDIIFE